MVTQQICLSHYISTHKVWVSYGGQKLPNAAVQQRVYRLRLVRDCVLEGSDHSTPHKPRLGLKVLTEIRQEDLRINKGQFPHTLCHHIPSSLLRTLEVLEQHFPEVEIQNACEYRFTYSN